MRKHVFEVVVKGLEISILELPLEEPLYIKWIKREGRLHTEFSMFHIDGKYTNINPQRDLLILDKLLYARDNISFQVKNRELFQEKIMITIWGD
ncbi:hypothetical protein [Jeotgalibacillus haloalkalitolerans]|uniref:Uncharacterized protein n=1 Tax=Jeotgalibacillus haloalkalitolerans TaxID=3104292 RepID=A0ABU5KNF2_9BACL|nr:hypothetical protein [Jeotgalibacillus sp. HH7-29]MDZ5712792.1 hypothetical protein [Jeotgalibacillus sp. HH7-29]